MLKTSECGDNLLAKYMKSHIIKKTQERRPSSSAMQTNGKTGKISQQLKFVPYQTNGTFLNIKKVYLSSSNQQSNQNENEEFEQLKTYQEFSHEQKQSLKNAFRYICRLVFKQANKYGEKQFNTTKKQADSQKQRKKGRSKMGHSSSISTSFPTLLEMRLPEQAELISGERYFKQLAQKLPCEQRQLLLQYMIWFLKVKYLRYINKCSNQNKGKRKQMKKQLYLKFKNLVMLPYLDQMLENCTKQLSSQV